MRAELSFLAETSGRLPLKVHMTSNDAIPITDATAAFHVNVDRPRLRVLCIEGAPRRTFRFLRSMLDGGEGIDLVGLAAWTDDEAEWPSLDHVDAVLLGDLEDAERVVPPARMEELHRFVDGGGGLALIAGPNAGLEGWRDTPIERMLPLIVPSTSRQPDLPATHTRPWNWTPAGRRSPLLRFGLPAEKADAFRAGLPGFCWYAGAGPAKPSAVVLAETADESAAPTPLIALGRFGRGRTLYLGTDELWRWRRPEFGRAFEQFWMQALRYLAGGRRQYEIPWLELRADPPSPRVGQEVRLLGEIPAGLPAPDEASVMLTGSGWQQELRLVAKTPDSMKMEAAFRPPLSGMVRATCPPLVGFAGEAEELSLQVRPADAELDDPRAQPDRLHRLAQATGGQVIAPAELLDTLLHWPTPKSELSIRQPAPVRRALGLLLFVILMLGLWLKGKG
jgi:hypothetical protein